MAVGAVRDAESRGRRRARRATSTSSTTRRRTTRCRSPSRGCRRRRSSRRCTTRPARRRSRCGRATPRRRSSRSRRSRRGCSQGLNVVARRPPRHRHGQLHVPREARRLPALPRPLHRGQGRAAGDRDRQARGHAADPRRRRRRLLSREGRARTSTARTSSTTAKPTTRQGEAVRRRARAALPDPGARAVRPRARRGDGVRHAGRRARSRRGPRESWTMASPASCSTTSSRWRTSCRASSISIAGAFASARSRGSASTAWCDEYVAVYHRLVDERRARR